MTDNDHTTETPANCSTDNKNSCGCGGSGGGPMIAIILGIIVIIVAVVLVKQVNTKKIDTDKQQDQASVQSDAKPADAKPADKKPAVAAGMAPLPLELPNPTFVGTPKEAPKNVKIDKKNLGKPRGPFLAPKGVTNIASGKTATSSDDFPIIGDLELVTDGDKEALDGRWVELAPDKQHVTIDLGKTSEIFAIVIWHYHGEARIYRDIIVQVSDDKDFKKNVKTIFNNDYDNSSKMSVGEDYEYYESFEGKLVDAKGVKARYVRCWSNGNTSDDQNHYAEVEVWGRAAK